MLAKFVAHEHELSGRKLITSCSNWRSYDECGVEHESGAFRVDVDLVGAGTLIAAGLYTETADRGTQT